jgi:hypothetical protein
VWMVVKSSEKQQSSFAHYSPTEEKEMNEKYTYHIR